MARGAEMARPERFELPTAWFVARYSIQLSYGRMVWLAVVPRGPHILLSSGAPVKAGSPLIHRAAGASVASRQREKLQFLQFPTQRDVFRHRFNP